MTISACIAEVDALVKNSVSPEQKTRYLSDLDGKIRTEVLGEERFDGYDYSEDAETALAVAAPYDRLYPLYVIAQIHAANEEPDRYNDMLTLYNTAYSDWSSWYRRANRPSETKKQFTVM